MNSHQSLKQYQQNLQQSVEQEAQRQQGREVASDETRRTDLTLTQRFSSSVKDAVAHSVDNLKQYGKEVVTGQKLWEGIAQDDGALDGWIAHGSTELANTLLHGHPAPVYARTLSPAQQQSEVEANEPRQSAIERQAEQQAAIDVGLPRETSLEMYQRNLQVEQQPEAEQELDR